MKYKLLLFSFLLNLAAFAQQLPNSSFEQWDTIGPYSQPTDWFTINELILENVTQSTVLTTDAYSGNYAALLKTVSTPFGTNLSGILATGSLLDNNYNITFDFIKFSYNYRPQTWELYYKFFPANKDTGLVLFVLTKWNTNKKKPDTIAVAGQLIADTQAVYTKLTLPFNYASGFIPDSAYVLISPNLKNNPPAGTLLYIDAMNVSGNVTSVAENIPQNKSFFTAYPNPAHDRIYIQSNYNPTLILVKDITGKTVAQSHEHTLATMDLPNGIYIIECLFENNMTATRKLIIQHP